MKPAYEFVAEQDYGDFGYCWFTSGDFCTFLHATPCTANTADFMDLNGWVLYVPPFEYYSKTYNRGKRSFVATYVKKNRGTSTEGSPPEIPPSDEN